MPNHVQKHLLKQVRRAINDFELIEPGDRIAVGLSGGKDSLALLWVLARLQKFRGFSFHLQAIHLDLGWSYMGLPVISAAELENLCRSLAIPLHIETTRIAEIVFQVRQEPNPCSLCAKLRRGALHRAALRFKCNKVALGHHADDVIETLFLNLFYTGRLETFSPLTYLSNTGLTLIRPLIYLQEKEINQAIRSIDLPPLLNPCPISGKTKRQEVKEVVSYLTTRFPDLHARVITAMRKKWLPASSS